MTEYHKYIVEFRLKTVSEHFGTPDAAVKAAAKSHLGNSGNMDATEYDIATFIKKYFYSVVRANPE
jgi:hypothetical protein